MNGAVHGLATTTASTPVPNAPVAPPAAETAPAATPEPAATRAPSEPRAQRVPQTGEYGPVASGETLWGIASNWSSGTGLDVNRVMIAIQRNNPDAFLNDNINLLKRGAILRMPEVSEVERISTSVAYSEVEQQEAEFTGQRAAALPAHQVEAFADGRQHAQRQHVHLEDAKRVDIVLVPANDGAILHAGIFDGNQFIKASLGDDKAADMLREVPRKPDELTYEIEQPPDDRAVRSQAGFEDAAVVDRLAVPPLHCT